MHRKWGLPSGTPETVRSLADPGGKRENHIASSWFYSIREEPENGEEE